MIPYSVLIPFHKGRNPIMKQVQAHDAVHAALLAWRALGGSQFPRIKLDIPQQAMWSTIQMTLDGVLTTVSRV